MRAYDIIAAKRDGGELSQEEIKFLIDGYVAGQIPDYQIAAWAMAVFLRGMTPRESAWLTSAMVESGDVIDLSAIAGKKIDKHSTGGVGDKTTLVLGPLVAAAGVKVAKMSGRGLGHTGGTLDKLESIPGFLTQLEPGRFIRQVNEIGLAVAGQSGNLVPADKKLYALRDVTATVDSIPLIASSVMSKKIASGANGIVLDVKTGSGAFMKTLEKSLELARAMVEIGTAMGRETVALVTDMDQPLGLAIGNALEVEEAIATLKGEGPSDLTELCLVLGAEMLALAGVAKDRDAARIRLEQLIAKGEALEKFRSFVLAQGGDPRVADDPALLPQARYARPILAEESGFIHGIDALAMGRAAMILGAGREVKESSIDPAVGITLKVKRGDRIGTGEPLAIIHAGELSKAAAVETGIKRAFTIHPRLPEGSELVKGRISGS